MIQTIPNALFSLIFLFFSTHLFLRINRPPQIFILLALVQGYYFLSLVFNLIESPYEVCPVGLMLGAILFKINDYKPINQTNEILQKLAILPYVFVGTVNTINITSSFNLQNFFISEGSIAFLSASYILIVYIYLYKSKTENQIVLSSPVAISLLYFAFLSFIFSCNKNLMTTNFGINYSLLIQLTLMLLTIIKFKKFYMLEFDESFYEVPVTNTPIPSIKMYKNSSLSEDKMELLAQKIEDKLAEEKVFLNPDLTLEQFALMVNIPKHHVSQVLNVHFQKNFHRMIGEYRVKHAIEIMEKTNQNLKIESIVYDSGFNCTKAFAKYFKDLTGQQPSSYIKAFSINTSNNKISV